MTPRYASPVEEVIAGMDSWNDVDRVPMDLVRDWRETLAEQPEPSGLLPLMAGVAIGAVGVVVIGAIVVAVL